MKNKKRRLNKKEVKVQKNKNFKSAKKVKNKEPLLNEETRRQVKGIVLLLTTLIVILGFFDIAGIGGHALRVVLSFLIGRSMYLIPFVLFVSGTVFVLKKQEKTGGYLLIGSSLIVIGFAGIFEAIEIGEGNGGVVGYIFFWPLSKLFGVFVAQVASGVAILTGFLLFWKVLKKHFEGEVSEAIERMNKSEQVEKQFEQNGKKVESFIGRVFKKREAPEFSIKSIEKEPSFVVSKDSLRPKKKEGDDILSSKTSYDYEKMLPSLDLISKDQGKPIVDDTNLNSSIIKKTLENFGIPVEMSGVIIGPTVTQFALKPAEGIKLSKITSLSSDLALSLAAHPIRIEAPIPGKSLVGIEVPNKTRSMVGLRSLFENPGFRTGTDKINIAFGKDVSGDVCFGNIAKMPHILVAGSTGSGKTIFLNALILSLLYQHTPDTLKMVLVDPKRVEFVVYAGLPHLLTPVIHHAGKAVKCLEWMIEEMEKRFDLMAQEGVRDIISYNKKSKDKMPYIIFVIDELADLMMARGKELESNIVRIAQMARAVGIHLVLATQRPSVEVITGLIKANIPARVSFLVASQIDSRTILDMAGAEKLLGSGDMLYLAANSSKPVRLQGAYVSEKEVKDVVEYIKSNYHQDIEKEDELSEELKSKLEETEIEVPDNVPGGALDEDPLFEEAKRIVVQYKKASASMLQRYLRVGYSRAARLIDILEERGIVSSQDGSKPREVFGVIDNDQIEMEELEDDSMRRASKEESTIIIDPDEDE